MLKKKKEEPNKFTLKMQKKLVVLFVFILLAFAGLSARIIVINKEDGQKYKKQVLAQQRYDSITLPFKRGDIIDTKGTRLAMSEKVYNLVLDCKQMLEKEAYLEPTIKALKTCFAIEEGEIRALVAANPKSQYYVLTKQMTYEQIRPFVELQNNTEKNPNIKGVWFEEEYRRTYPNNALACDVIGFTGTDNNGSYGLEEYYNTILNGINGREYGYLNDDSNLERTTKAAVDGNSIVTTIDANIQNIVEKHMLIFNTEHKGKFREEDEGSTNTGIIVMDPNNGEVLAMASYPNFDLNNPKDLTRYYKEEEIAAMDDTARTEKWNELWRNFCIFNTYEPGSTAKLFTVGAGLEYGKLAGNESYNCGGFMEIKGNPKPIKCNNIYGHGPLDVSGAIGQSCNVAMMQMGFAMGKETFMNELKNLNIGLKTNIDLAGEGRTESLIFDVNKMVPTDLAIASFGQGYNVTMIQMATAFSSLINGGYYYEPHVVKKIISPNGATVKNIEPRVLKQTVSASTSKKIVQYCDAAVADGTGRSARPAGYTMGGKTGTAEKFPRGTKNYVVSFIGYAPAANPEVLVYVVIDEPNEQSQPHAYYATGVARNIMTEVLRYMNIFMTEELSEEEKAELEALNQTILRDPSVSENSVSGNTASENTASENAMQNTDQDEKKEAEKKEVQIDPETGYGIIPETGELFDPETGQPIDDGSLLGGL